MIKKGAGSPAPEKRNAERRPGELGFVELLRWAWRQLTSMRTALVLLFLLALAAIPGSVFPQNSVDSFAVSQWKEDHPKLTPIYEKLGMFDVFGSPWFSAIYLLLAVSLVGCILPRTKVYWRAFRAAPPAAPRNLTRLPHSASYETAEGADVVSDRAIALLRRKHYRVVAEQLRDGEQAVPYSVAVSAERGYLREAGNLLFHIAVLVVLAGFAIGSLWGYKGGVIIMEDSVFSNTPTQYDDFTPGKLTQQESLDRFSLRVDDFDIEWLLDGPRAGMARKFVAGVTWWGEDGSESTYDLRVNHPLSIDGTDVFLIGHGYAPVITVRDGNGEIAYDGPTPFLPQDQRNFTSYGVIKVPDAKPTQIGLEGLFLPTFQGDPLNSAFGDDLNPLVTMQAYAGDLGLDSGAPQSVYTLETDGMKLLEGKGGKMFRVDLRPGETIKLPEGAGSVTFEGVKPWVRVEIAKKPGTMLALTGAILALLGLCASLFIRPRRLWVRATRSADGTTLVEVAGLDRSSGGDLADDMADFVAALRGAASDEAAARRGVQEDQ